MKLLGLILGIIAVLAVEPALAATPAATLTVSGQGSATSVPDLATLNLGINTTEDVAQDATSKNNAIYAKIEVALRALGIAKADVTTVNYNLNFVPRPTVVRPPQPYEPRYGYTVSRAVSVKVHDVNLAGNAIDAAVAAGASNVNSVNFGLENPQRAYDSAMRLAIANATGQAKSMADAAHLRLGRIQNLQSGFAPYPQPFPMPLMSRVAASPQMPTEIAPAGVTVRATVTITYLISPRN
ncbi:MAG: SIMPL domain-containing protein [Candidatus Eremiobacteraeota bacterium]|nr:SIMPL domain-containing protein [Candidatus Eremiobacteraeota bacterium]